MLRGLNYIAELRYMLTSLRRNSALVLPLRIACTVALSLILVWRLVENAAAVVRITDDRGGNIGAYWSRYMALRDAGEEIIIDGVCSSACTLVLGIVPHDRICVTPPGVLVFSASRLLMIPPHARFGTSIRCQFNGGSAAMAGSALQQFICLAQSSCACTDNAADDCLQEWQK
jgi:hypothetical protein